MFTTLVFSQTTIGRFPFQIYNQKYIDDSVNIKLSEDYVELSTNLDAFCFTKPIILNDTSLSTWSDLENILDFSTTELDSSFKTLEVDKISSYKEESIEIASPVTFESGINVPWTQTNYSTTLNVDFTENSKQFVSVTGDLTFNVTGVCNGTNMLLLKVSGSDRTITIGTGAGRKYSNSDDLNGTEDYWYLLQFENVSATDTADFYSISEFSN